MSFGAFGNARRFASSWSPRAIWDKLSDSARALKRATVFEPSKKPTIAVSPEHSLAAKFAEAKHELYLLRCKEFNRFSVKTAFLKYSPQKLNEVARLLHGLTLPVALKQMKFCDRKGARIGCVPAIRLAMNVVRQRMGRPEDFVVEQAMVGRGSYRIRPDYKGRGRMGIIRRPQAILRLVCARSDPAAKMGRELRRSLHRMFKGQPRETKPVMCRLRYF